MPKHLSIKRIWLFLLAVLAVGMVVYRFESLPPIWFDEGWSLSLARNWVELGHYGHLQLGEPVPATVLNTGFPVVGPLALSFKLFGLGAWQARVPGMLFTLGGLAALYYAAARLYDVRIGLAAVFAALLLPVYPDLHPIFLGRQVLGEMPAVFYLLLGFAVLPAVWNKSPYFLSLPALFWALSLRTKPQVLPFVVFSVAIVLLASVILKSRTTARTALLFIGFTLFLDRVLAWSWSAYVRSHTLSQNTSTDPYAVLGNINALLTYVLVLNTRVRLTTLHALLLFAGLLPLIGSIWNGVVLLRETRRTQLSTPESAVRLMLWAFTVSWFAWHLFLSIGWLRYLFPAAFLGNIQLALCLHEVTGGFSFRRSLDRAAAILLRHGRRLASVATITMVVLVSVVFALNTRTLLALGRAGDDGKAAEEVASFLNTQTDPTDLIEAYESELFFLLDRRYHFPPDHVQHELNRRKFLGEDIVINYDPLELDPDYIVSGPMDQMWGLYQSTLEHHAFRLVFESGSYRVYQQHR